jgi:phosphatidylserine/phosphatidylglycerophosphate/cardiolipin synthase-like enzyme
VAFAGGIDLTLSRRDTSRHAADDETRTNPDGTTYGPVHDTQMAVDGEAARDLADLARARWMVATGERLPASPAARDLWPADLPADFNDVAVLIARTVPRWRGMPRVREAIALTLDALSAARQAIYVEAQYLTSLRVRNRLGDILGRERGPEVVIVASCSSEGPIERFVMGANRDRFIRRLKRLDRFDRLRVLYPVVPAAEGTQPVLVHSKLIIVDEQLLRVGSSNLNNRSVGLDTECDLAIEAGDAATAVAIGRVRDSLLAEHLGVERADVSAVFESERSLVRVLDRLGGGARTLRPFSAMSGRGPARPIPGTGLLDPEGPVGVLEFVRRKRGR